MSWFKKGEKDIDEELEQELPIKEKVVLEDKSKLLPLQLSLGNIYECLVYGEEFEPLQSKAFPLQLEILKWNLERNNIDFVAENEEAMLDEEELEMQEAINNEDTREVIDALLDKYVIDVGMLAKSGMAGIELSPKLRDYYADYLSIPKIVRGYGIDFNRALKEVLREINSRQQDPAQKQRWAEQGNNGEKWQKDLNQDPSTLYKADICSCQLCKCGKK